MRSTKRTSFARSLGAIGLLGLLQGGACAVPNRGDPPAPDITTTEDTAGTAGEISGDGDEPDVLFAESIHPIEMAKCSLGCHATGAGGFTISGDVDADYDATFLRVNLDTPASSKLLKKISGGTNHGGGALLAEDSEEYELIAKWISDGALP